MKVNNLGSDLTCHQLTVTPNSHLHLIIITSFLHSVLSIIPTTFDYYEDWKRRCMSKCLEQRSVAILVFWLFVCLLAYMGYLHGKFGSFYIKRFN